MKSTPLPNKNEASSLEKLSNAFGGLRMPAPAATKERVTKRHETRPKPAVIQDKEDKRSKDITINPASVLQLNDVYTVLADQRKFIKHKVREGIAYKLRISIPKDDLDELVSDAMMSMLERFISGKISFESSAKLIGYILFSCWCNYRAANFRKTKLDKDYDKKVDEWMEEGTTIMPIKRREYMFVPLNDTDDFIAEPTRDETDADLTDRYYGELYVKLFEELENAVQFRKLSFREVGIYKMYILNNWTMVQLVAESDFSRTICYDAVKKVKTHLAAVDWKIKTDDDED